MNPRATGPEFGEWLAAAIRGFHPLRWGLCLVAIAATWVVAALTQALFEWTTPRWADWWENPVGQSRSLGEAIASRSTFGIAIRLGPAIAVAAAVWSLAGAWVARHELLARLRGRPDMPYTPPTPGPTGLVTGKVKELVLCCPLVLILATVALLPIVIATWINLLPGVGAIFVALFWPLVLLAGLVFLLLASGGLAWPLMAVTLATENSDTFDALSRAYNYAYARPIRFVVLLAFTIAIAALPLAGVVFALDGPLAGVAALTQQTLVFAAAGLSASLFWSLQTLVYLHLREAIDETDVREVAGAPEAPAIGEYRPASVPEKSASVNERKPSSFGFARLRFLVPNLLIFTATWLLTVWLFMRSGGEDAHWIGWGLFEGFIPPATGLYKVASVLAAIWGVVWFTAPFLVAGRQLIRGDEAEPKPATTGERTSTTA